MKAIITTSNPAITSDAIMNDAMAKLRALAASETAYISQLLPYRISVKDHYPEAVYMLHADGKGFFAKGDVHAIKAKQKGGKTNAIAMMAAAVLSGKNGLLTCSVPDSKVLVIDTEQNGRDTQRIYKMTLALAGLPEEDIYDRFQTFCLRSMDIAQKHSALQQLIAHFQPDIVFVDGIVDMVNNFNDETESKNFITELMRLSTKDASGKEIAIVCVMHTNKSKDDDNMRGHLGTILAQKSSTNLMVERNSNVFTIRDTCSRHELLPPWSFSFNEYGMLTMCQCQRTEATRNEGDAPRSPSKPNHTTEVIAKLAIKFINNQKEKVKCMELNIFLQGALGLSESAVRKKITDMKAKNYISITSDNIVFVP